MISQVKLGNEAIIYCEYVCVCVFVCACARLCSVSKEEILCCVVLRGVLNRDSLTRLSRLY